MRSCKMNDELFIILIKLAGYALRMEICIRDFLLLLYQLQVLQLISARTAKFLKLRQRP